MIQASVSQWLWNRAIRTRDRRRSAPAHRISAWIERLESRLMLHGSGVDVKWTFGDTEVLDGQFNQKYVLTSFSTDEDNIGRVGEWQPDLRLVVGTRYSVSIASPETHPLEIIAKGATADNDRVLLSQDNHHPRHGRVVGDLESDPGVNWLDHGDGTIEFTLTPQLVREMSDPEMGRTPGYRCGLVFHRGFQRGNFIIIGETDEKHHGGVPDGLNGAQIVSLDHSTGSLTHLDAIEHGGDVDRFAFVAPASGRLQVDQRAVHGSEIDSFASAFWLRGGPDEVDNLLGGDRDPLSRAFRQARLLAGNDDHRGQPDSRIDFDVFAGQWYLVEAAGLIRSTGAYELQFTMLAPPAEPPDGTLPEGPPAAQTLLLDASGYGTQEGEIQRPGDTDWVRFQAPVSGEMTIRQLATAGTPLDSRLAVFRAGAGAPVLIEENDDSGPGLNSMVRLDVVAGESYLVQAAASPFALLEKRTGRYRLTLAVDDFPDRPDAADVRTIPLESGSGSQSGNIGEPGDQDVFRYVAETTGPVTVLLNAAFGSTLDPHLHVRSATDEWVDDDSGDVFNSRRRIEAVAGQAYHVEVSGVRSSTGAYELLVTTGDDFGDRFPAPGEREVRFDANGTGSQSGTIDDRGDVDVFQFVSPVDGVLTITQTAPSGSKLQSALTVFQASAVRRPLRGRTESMRESPLARTDAEAGEDAVDKTDAGFNPSVSRVDLRVSKGARYFVQAAGAHGKTGRYRLNLAVDDDVVDQAPEPREQTRSIVLSAAGSGSSAGAMQVPGDVDVFQFQAPLSGTMFIAQTTEGLDSRLDAFLSVFDTPDRTEPVAENDDTVPHRNTDSRVVFEVLQGQTYFVEARGIRYSTGAYRLEIHTVDFGDGALSTTALGEDGLTPQEMASLLLDRESGIRIDEATIEYQGALRASGRFSGGQGILDSRGAPSGAFLGGILLTTGDVKNVVGPNDDGGSGIQNGTSGDVDLNELVAGATRDAAVLSFDFVPETEVVEFEYVFASEEYTAFVGSLFNDVFGLFVNGVNYARVPDSGTHITASGTAVSINNVNDRWNSHLFVSNAGGEPGGFLNVQMNGLTAVLTVRAPVNAGARNTLKIAIADTVDEKFDSAVFLRAGSFRAVPDNFDPAAGQRQLARLDEAVRTAEATPGRHAAGEVHLSIHDRVLSGTLKEIGSRLLHDFLVIPVDPVDFTLLDSRGRPLAVSKGGQPVSQVPNAFYEARGANQFLIVPNAASERYTVQLAGLGTGEFRFGASFVTAFGQVTTRLFQGNLAGTTTTAVLDFSRPDGSLRFAHFAPEGGEITPPMPLPQALPQERQTVSIGALADQFVAGSLTTLITVAGVMVFDPVGSAGYQPTSLRELLAVEANAGLGALRGWLDERLGEINRRFGLELTSADLARLGQGVFQLAAPPEIVRMVEWLSGLIASDEPARPAALDGELQDDAAVPADADDQSSSVADPAAEIPDAAPPTGSNRKAAVPSRTREKPSEADEASSAALDEVFSTLSDPAAGAAVFDRQRDGEEPDGCATELAAHPGSRGSGAGPRWIFPLGAGAALALHAGSRIAKRRPGHSPGGNRPT